MIGEGPIEALVKECSYQGEFVRGGTNRGIGHRVLISRRVC